VALRDLKASAIRLLSVRLRRIVRVPLVRPY
jgi:hypothetical protein